MRFRPIILCYHRVADVVNIDHNRLAVPPKTFRRQIEFLRKNRKFVSLDEMLLDPKANTVAVTFDDGYKDNYKIAADILMDYQIPASFFLATRFIEYSVSYYTSSFSKIWAFFQETKQIPSLISGSVIEKLLRTEKNYFPALQKLSSQVPDQLWTVSELLHSALMDIDGIDDLELPLSVSEVHSLLSSSLFTIGPHTATHPRMSSIPLEDALADFAESVATTTRWGGFKTQNFPYPFGQRSDFNYALESRIHTSHSFTGLSTVPMALGHLKPASLTFPRLSVQDWDTNKFRHILNIANAFSYVPFAAIAGLKVSAGIRRLGTSS